ncbi:hypothetical protein M3553_22770, partial [Bacillus subtilis]|nr:hypothetical protein [Bacillus subtilis]
PTYRLRPLESGLCDLVKHAGEEISRKLGYKGSYPSKLQNADDVDGDAAHAEKTQAIGYRCRSLQPPTSRLQR